MKAILFPFVSGVLFAVGLALGGMTQPAKIIGFLDVLGEWDPSLALVMVGAIGIYFPLYRWILRRSAPVFASQYCIPMRKEIDRKLVMGAALFGIGWGPAGYCPGPALASLGTVAPTVLLFVGAMLCGMFGHHVFSRGEPPGT